MAGAIFATSLDGIDYLKFEGIVRYSHCSGLESYIDKLFKSQNIDAVVIDLEDAEILDSTALGLLARIAIEYKKISSGRPVIFLKEGELDKIIKRVCFDQVFDLVYNNFEATPAQLTELVSHSENEDQVLQRVILAHRNLAKLNAKNENLYRDITKALS